MANSSKSKYLKELKQTDPVALKKITKKAAQKSARVRKEKADFRKSFRDIYEGLLSTPIYIEVTKKDKSGKDVKDKNGKLVKEMKLISQKEILVMKNIETIKKNGVKNEDIKHLSFILKEQSELVNIVSNDLLSVLDNTQESQKDDK
ncbi:MAG: hypothetical protein LBH46_04350 [Rickettsiales bacterium]|jgi:transposase|nr:hypothetical protein [Rickettsiales bacterium]